MINPIKGDKFKIIKEFYLPTSSEYNRSIQGDTVVFIKEVEIAPKRVKDYMMFVGSQYNDREKIYNGRTIGDLKAEGLSIKDIAIDVIKERGPYGIFREERRMNSRGPYIEIATSEYDKTLKPLQNIMKKSELAEVIKSEIRNILTENESVSVGDKVTIPNDLTTDPIHKQGETGEVKSRGKNGVVYVLFDDGLVGGYQESVFNIFGDTFDIRKEATEEEVENQKDLNDELEKTADLTDKMKVDENMNKELEFKVGKFVKNIAKLYDYSLEDAYYAVQQTLDRERKLGIYRGDDYVIENNLNEGIWSSGNDEDINKFIDEIKRLKDEYHGVVGSDDVFNGLDNAEQGARDLLGRLNEEEDDNDVEPTAKDLKKPDSVVVMAQELDATKKEMKSLVKKWKTAEGDEKENIKKQLKKLTRIKNELEELL